MGNWIAGNDARLYGIDKELTVQSFNVLCWKDN